VSDKSLKTPVEPENAEKQSPSQLLLRAEAFIDAKNLEEAEKNCDTVLSAEPENKHAQLLKRIIELEKSILKTAKKARRKLVGRIIGNIIGLTVLFALVMLFISAGKMCTQLSEQWSFDDTTGTLTINQDIGIEQVSPGFIGKVDKVLLFAEKLIPGITEYSSGWQYEMDRYLPGFSGASVPWDEYDARIKSVVLEDGVSTIIDEAFADCLHLSSVKIPAPITNIGDSAFRNCTELRAITLPDSVAEIGQFAFSGCIGLSDFSLPPSVSEIKSSTFVDCT